MIKISCLLTYHSYLEEKFHSLRCLSVLLFKIYRCFCSLVAKFITMKLFIIIINIIVTHHFATNIVDIGVMHVNNHVMTVPATGISLTLVQILIRGQLRDTFLDSIMYVGGCSHLRVVKSFVVVSCEVCISIWRAGIGNTLISNMLYCFVHV